MDKYGKNCCTILMKLKLFPKQLHYLHNIKPKSIFSIFFDVSNENTTIKSALSIFIFS